MPLNEKGQKILGAMEKTYGDPKVAKSVLYASKNAGKITGIDGATADEEVPDLEAQGGEVNNALDPAEDFGGGLWKQAGPKGVTVDAYNIEAAKIWGHPKG